MEKNLKNYLFLLAMVFSSCITLQTREGIVVSSNDTTVTIRSAKINTILKAGKRVVFAPKYSRTNLK